MKYLYFEWEDRVYRAPEDDPQQMEIWDSEECQYEPYLGDATCVARVIFNASQSDTEPALVH